ncbi:MAG: diguanylate cyclase [bacterium]
MTDLTRSSKGNPLFVWQYLRTLRQAGAFLPDWGKWRIDDELIEEVAFSGGTMDLMKHWLGQLSNTFRRVLAVGALIGDTFSGDQLGRVLLQQEWNIDQTEIQKALTEGLTQRLLERDQRDDRFRFVHDRFREALLLNLEVESEEKADLHAAIAEDFDTSFNEFDKKQIYQRARHYLEAGNRANNAEGFKATLAAAKQAADSEAWDSCYEFVSGAEDFQTSEDKDVIKDLYELKGRSALQILKPNISRESFNKALDRTDDPHERARIRVESLYTSLYDYRTKYASRMLSETCEELGHTLPTDRYPTWLVPVVLFWSWIVAATRRLVQVPDNKDEPATEYEKTRSLLVDLSAHGCVTSFLNKKPLRFVEWAILSYRWGVESNTHSKLARGLGYYSVLLHVLNRVGFGERTLALAQEHAHRSENKNIITETELFHSTCNKTMVGDAHSLLDVFQKKRDQIDWLNPVFVHYIHVFRGLAELFRGYTAEAADSAVDLLKVYRQTKDHIGAPIFGKHVGKALQAYSMQGDFHRASEYYELAENIKDSVSEQTADTIYWQSTAHQLCFLRQQQDFGKRFEQVLEEFTLSPDEADAWEMMHFVSLAYARIDMAMKADENDRNKLIVEIDDALDQLKRCFQGIPYNELVECHYLTAKGGYHRLQGNVRKANEIFDQAMKLSTEKDNPWAIFEIRRQQAHLHLDQNRPEAARRSALEAMALARHMGWSHWPDRLVSEFTSRHLELGRSIDTAHEVSQSTPASNSPQPKKQQSHSPPEEALVATRQLDALKELTLACRNVFDPDQQAGIALEKSLELLGAERALVYFTDEGTDRLNFADGRKISVEDVPEPIDEPEDISRTILGNVQEKGETVILSSTEEGEELGAESVIAHDLRSVIAAPLQTADQFIGVLYLDNQLAQNVFDEQDAEVLESIATHVAVTLETARAAKLEVELAEAKQKEQFARTVRRLTEALSSTLNLSKALRKLFKVLEEEIPFEAAIAVILHDDGDADVPIEWGVDTPEEYAEFSSKTSQWAGTGEDSSVVLTQPEATTLSDQPHMGLQLGESRGSTAIVWLRRLDKFDDHEVDIAETFSTQASFAFENTRLFEEVKTRAEYDSLTGLLNRKTFMDRIEEQRPIDKASLLMMDIDHFKEFNDTHGHEVGDKVLEEVANTIKNELRNSDIVARYGGEEFVAFLPESSLKEASRIAARIREAIERMTVEVEEHGELQVTLSLGISEFENQDSPDTVLEKADTALYSAKENGRNRIEVSSPEQ